MAYKSEFFEIVEIPGKGLGCVAICDIPRGTTIHREKLEDKPVPKNFFKDIHLTEIPIEKAENYISMK